MRFQLVARRIMLAPALALALAAAVTACSSSSSSSTTSTGATSAPASSASASAPASSSSSTAVAQITANWEKFFNSSTPPSRKVTLLQNGSAFGGAISSLMGLVSRLASKVTNVTLNSATSATVTYNLTAGGTPLFPSSQTGTAVLQDGVWKVGDATLCGLMKLVPGGSTPAACTSVS